MVTEPVPLDGDPSAIAPGGLERVRRFANSLDRYRGRDDLQQVVTARRLLRGLADGGTEIRIDAAALPDVRLARAGLRWAIGCSTLWSLEEGDSEPKDPSWNPRVHLALSADGLKPTERGLDAVLSEMTLDLLVAQRTRSIARLKPCANPGCQWVFWDASRPGSGRWCSMRLCGSRAKSRRFRARHADRDRG